MVWSSAVAAAGQRRPSRLSAFNLFPGELAMNFMNCGAVAALVLCCGSFGSVALAQETLVGVTTTGSVVTFRSNTPGTLLSSMTISGLNAGDRVLGIDMRPATGELFAMGETSQIYRLNASTGVATPVGGAFTPALDGSPFTRYSMDFNPTVDRIRVVGAGAQNRRLVPDTGAAVTPDTNLSFNPPIGFGLPPRAVGVAYTNSVAGAPLGSTREYILDSLNNILGEVGTMAGGNASFNVGVIGTTFSVRLGASVLDFDDNAGFDVSGATGVAYVSLNMQNSPAGTPTGLYTLDLATGQATSLGMVPTGVSLRDLAVIPAPGSAGVLAAGVLVLSRRRRLTGR